MHNICKVWMELNYIWYLYWTSCSVIMIIILIILWDFLHNLTGLCDSYSVVSSCGLMDSDSQGPSKGGTGESWCPAAPSPACWTDISLLQEDLSFCVTGIFFMGFLSFAMWSHLLTPALRRFSVVSPSGQGLVSSATDLNWQKTIIRGQCVILCACYWSEDLWRAAFRITLRLF